MYPKILAISFALNQIFCLVSIYEINSISNSLFVNSFSIIVITIVYIIYFEIVLVSTARSKECFWPWWQKDSIHYMNPLVIYYIKITLSWSHSNSFYSCHLWYQYKLHEEDQPVLCCHPFPSTFSNIFSSEIVCASLQQDLPSLHGFYHIHSFSSSSSSSLSQISECSFSTHFTI